MGHRAWVRATAAELVALDAPDTASRLRACGSTAEVSTCGACGDPLAAVVVRRLPCNVRGCVWCSRARAAEDGARYFAAARRIPSMVAARAPVALAVAERVEREALAQKRQTRPAIMRAARARRHRYDLRSALSPRGWLWRLVTISPQWDPSDAHAYTVEGLQARVADAWARWARVWDLFECPAAGALARIEISTGGHVHVHALIYSARREAIAIERAAGCFVDVRAVTTVTRTVREADSAGRVKTRTVTEWDLQGAIREAIKYAVKAPSPLRAGWIGGSAFRVTHPALAARWIVATASRQLVRIVGIFRDAFAAERLAQEAEKPPENLDAEPPTKPPPPHVAPLTPRQCASCGSECVSARYMATAMVARALAQRRAWEFHAKRQDTAIPLPARVVVEIAVRRN